MLDALTPLVLSHVQRAMSEIVRREMDAEDVAQIALWQVCAGLDGTHFEEDARFLTWVYRITDHVLQNQYRFFTREKRSRESESPLTAMTADLAEYYGPVEAAIEHESAVLVRGAVRQLTPKLAQAVSMVHLMGRSVAECAATLEIPESTIRRRLERGLARLALLLRD